MNGNPYVPADWTDVFFDGSISVKNSVIDSDFQGTVESIIIQNGYSGTITQSHDLTVTSGFRGGFTQECGSFNSNPSYAFYAGDFCVNGGIFRRLTGSGILSDPYMIYDVYGLQGLGREDDAGDANGLFAYWDNHNMGTSFYVKLANAIDASGTVNWNGGAGFIPLAFDSIQGTDSNFLDFNGNHQNISGLYIKQSGDNIGFFRKLGGYYGTEKIYDLSLAGGTIEATGQVSSLGNLGSLVGIVDGAVTITNCHSNATVRITALEPYDMGGLIGSLTGGGSQYSSVTGCSFTGRLEHSYYLNYAGGLIGGIWSGFNNISNCWVTLANKPLADQQVGGLIGNITGGGLNGDQTISNCTVEADFDASYIDHDIDYNYSYSFNIGGLIGLIDSDDTLNISGCRTSGNITTTSGYKPNYCGGLIGTSQFNSTSFTACTSEVNLDLGDGSCNGGLIGELNGWSGSLTNCSAAGSVRGWNCCGGLIGEIYNFSQSGNVSGCSASGTVILTGSCAGGLIGDAIQLTSITGSHYSGTVNGGNQTGGLVGSASQVAAITSCEVYNAVVSGLAMIGGLLGDANEIGTIESCYSNGSVNGSGNAIGSLIGDDGGDPTNLVNKCSSEANISSPGSAYVGGLIGMLNGPTLSNSYARGAVQGASVVGGLVGETSASGNPSITNCYSTGLVASGGSNVGGLIGYNNSGAPYDISGSYYDSQEAGVPDNGLGTPETTASMKTQSTYGGWDFVNTWEISPEVNSGYPFFGHGLLPSVTYTWTGSVEGDNRWSTAGNWDVNSVPSLDGTVIFNSTSTKDCIINIPIDVASISIEGYNGNITQQSNVSIESTFFMNSGIFVSDPSLYSFSAHDFYTDPNCLFMRYTSPTMGTHLIYDIYGLQALNCLFSRGWNSDIQLHNNIDASSTVNWNSGAGFIPLNVSATDNYVFNGKGKTISDLIINLPGTDYVGLFGQIFASGNSTYSIKKINLSNSRIRGHDYVGSLAAFCVADYENHIIVMDCGADGISVTGEGTEYGRVGGLLGKAYNTSIIQSYVTGEIISSASGYSGGFVGGADNLSVIKCYANIPVYAAFGRAGGMFGELDSGCIISDCYARGPVTCGSITGGFIGWNNGSTLSKCYSTGRVISSDPSGGFVGLSNSNVNDCYYDQNTSGMEDTNSGSNKRETAQMTLEATFTNWDFSSTWEISAGVNDGYPALRPVSALLISDFSATALSTNELSYSWSRPATAESGYYILDGSNNILMRLPAGTTSTTESGLLVNTQYTRKIAAYNSIEIATSDAVSRYTMIEPVSGISVVITGKTAILRPTNLSFSNISSGESGIRFEDDTNIGSSGWIRVLSWTDAGVTPNIPTDFRVWTRNGDGIETSPAEALSQESNSLYIWTGSGTNEYWSNPDNWSPQGIPGANDSVMFTTFEVDSVIDQSFGGDIGSVFIDSPYFGTITQSRNLTVETVFSQFGGTFESDPSLAFSAYDFQNYVDTDVMKGLFKRCSVEAGTYLISDVYGLQGLTGLLCWSNNLISSSTINVRLTKDISAAGTENWCYGGGFFPLCFDSYGTGNGVNFDGNNKRILGLATYYDSWNFYGTNGLFAYINPDEYGNSGPFNISNLTLSGGVIDGDSACGSIVGNAYETLNINNCHSDMTITVNSPTDTFSGGLVGWVRGDIDNQKFLSINNSSYTGQLTDASGQGLYAAGGLVGMIEDGFGQISNCSSSLNISCSAFVGGLIGVLSNDGNPGDYEIQTGTISGCDTTFNCELKTWGFAVGGLIGSMAISSNAAPNKFNISDCTVTGSIRTDDGINPNNIGGLIGYIDYDLGYSNIDGCTTNVQMDLGDTSNAGGIIGYAGDSDAWTGSLTNCIASGTITISSGSDGDIGGLIGSVYGDLSGSIDNCSATGAVNGAPETGGEGGLIGAADDLLSITNSHYSGAVSGNGNVGGLIGYAYQIATIEGCYSSGSVTEVYINNESGSYFGGLIGQLDEGWMDDSSHISKCSSEASVIVTNGNYVGGLIGYFDNPTYGNPNMIFADCYARGSVEGSDDVGGLIGYVDAAYINSSYSTGRVTSLEGATYYGGLIGNLDTESGPSGVNNCFYDSETSGQGDSDGRGTPESTSAMNTLATFADAGWSIGSTESTWSITPEVNDGYPCFGFSIVPVSTYTWVGSGNWSRSRNWSPRGVPGADDTVIFDSTSTSDAIIDSSFGGIVSTVEINPGYTGTIAQRRNFNVSTIFSQLDGTFESNTNYIFTAYNFGYSGDGIFNRTTGEGSAIHPYQVFDVYGLQGLTGLITYWDSLTTGETINIKLANDIDASGTNNWKHGWQGFYPILFGQSHNQINFDGNHKRIIDMFVSNMGGGLFVLGGGDVIVQPFNVSDLTISGGTFEGGISGSLAVIANGNVHFSNCHSDASVIGDNAGGLIGQMSSTDEALPSITGSTFTGKLSTPTDDQLYATGGIVGQLFGNFAEVSNCSSVITSTTSICGGSGGLIGVIDGVDSGSITGCTAEVNFLLNYDDGDNYSVGVGGLIGQMYDCGNITIEGCRASGFIDTPAGYVPNEIGGLIGGNNGDSGSLISNCTAEVDLYLAGGTYSGGFIGEESTWAGSLSNCTATGNITIDSGSFAYIGGLVGNVENDVLSGNIDRCLVTGTVRSASNIAVGGLIGRAQFLNSLTNSRYSGNVYGNFAVGGLIGYCPKIGTIEGCSTSGNIIGIGGSVTYLGGLIGELDNFTVVNKCSSDANVLTSNTSDLSIGGLIGVVGPGIQSSLSNCYARGSVETSAVNVGGLIGRVIDNTTITNCYSAGHPVGSTNVGGMIGLVGSSNNSISSCYYDSQEAGRSENDGRGTPETTANMKKQATYVGWDFNGPSETSHVWGIDQSGIINNGYPYFGQSSSSESTTYLITSEAGSHGTISPSGETVVQSGSNETYLISPEAGYHTLGLLIDSSTVAATTEYIFTNVTTNHTILASFEINPTPVVNPPSVESFSNVTTTVIQTNWGTGGTAGTLEYYCENTSKETNSGWISDLFWRETSLEANTFYQYRVKARDTSSNESSWTNLGSQETADYSTADASVAGVSLQNGDTISSDLTVTVSITGETSITSRSLSSLSIGGIKDVQVDGVSVAYSIVLRTGTSITLRLTTPLAVGTHTIKIFTYDYSGTIYVMERHSLQVMSGELITVGPTLVYPNPYDPLAGNLKISYYLSLDSDIILYVFDTSGRIVWKSIYLSGLNGGKAGYNEILWNAVDMFGNQLSSNGYIVDIIEKSSGKQIGKTKLMVWKGGVK